MVAEVIAAVAAFVGHLGVRTSIPTDEWSDVRVFAFFLRPCR
jgi:hypothetical protein